MVLGPLENFARVEGWRRLTAVYTLVLAVYWLAAVVLWYAGIRAIYECITPFYAQPIPAFASVLIPGATIAAAWLLYLLALQVCRVGPLKRRVLNAVVWGAFVVVLAIAVAFEASANRLAVAELVSAQWPVLRWHGLVVAWLAAALCALTVVLRRIAWFEDKLSNRTAFGIVVGAVVFAAVFAACVAMLRNGSEGIARAYSRLTYEYTGDLRKVSSLADLFRSYQTLHPYLSIHARVHPPGPIALLLLFSYVVGRDPLALSLATIAFGSAAMIPLYLWSADLAGRRVALTCCLLYSVVPSVVLFTATSADVLFTPFTLTGLFLFWRALHRKSVAYAVAAGLVYALMTLLSFSLASLGVFFALVALWRFAEPSRRRPVLQTAGVMLLSFLAVHIALRFWSGFDVMDCFKASLHQFARDQAYLDRFKPRYPSWAWKFLNPLSWFYYAGIPVSLLFLWRLRRPDASPPPQSAIPASRGLFLVFALTAAALSLLYLGRGEGERSALYVFPFLTLPAAHLLDQIGSTARSQGPLLGTIGFLGFQCWLTESVLNTFW